HVVDPVQLPRRACIERKTDMAIPSRRTAQALDMVPAGCVVAQGGYEGAGSRARAGSKRDDLLHVCVIG
nr:hypothetical protein [Tanacetum cinerariifolium]